MVACSAIGACQFSANEKGSCVPEQILKQEVKAAYFMAGGKGHHYCKNCAELWSPLEVKLL